MHTLSPLHRAPRVPKADRTSTDEPTTDRLPIIGRTPDTAGSPWEGGADTTGLAAHRLALALDGRQVLADLSFTAAPGTLTAIIGPSGADATALATMLGGAVRPGSGHLILDGHDVHIEHELMRSHIGMVADDDLLHPQLTVEQALGFAAELRLPPGTSADDRRDAVRRVLREVELTPTRFTQVGHLPDDQRTRASLAVELLSEPSMLVVAEPAPGPDPARAHQTMATLRRLADAGRIVVVVTTSLPDTQLCDQVVLLTSQGTSAFAGPPAEIEAALDTTDWSDIAARVHIDPDGVGEACAAHGQAAQPPTEPPTPFPEADSPGPPATTAPSPDRTGWWHQLAVTVRRQTWIIVGDQRYLIFLTVLPIFFAAVSLLVPGHDGLGPADPYGQNPDQAVAILVVLIMGAVVMGTTLTVRDVIGERHIFRREQLLGLSVSAHLAAKITVYSVVVIIQTGILTMATVLGKGGLTGDATLLGDPAIELYAAVATTAIVSAITGLVLSSVATYKQQLLPVLVLVLLLSLVFCGGISPLTTRPPVEQISWLFPARWGFAAAASTVDLRAIDLLATQDMLWTHSPGRWLFDMAMLIVLGAVGIGFLRWRLRAPRRRTHGNPPTPESHHRRTQQDDQAGTAT